MARSIRYIVFFCAALLIGTGSTFAQGKPRLAQKLSSDSSVFSLVVAKDASFEIGKTTDVRVKIRPHKDWHLYSSTMSADVGPTPLTFTLPAELTKTFKIVGVKEIAKPVKKYDENFDGETVSIYGPFEVILKIKTLQSAAIGKSPLRVYAEYTTCSESICLPPRTFEIPMKFLGQKDVTVEVLEAKVDSAAIADEVSKTDTTEKALTAPAKSAEPTQTASTSSTVPEPATVSSESDLLEVANSSLWEFILLTVGFGLLALVTPCVFPMIPITVSFFTKRNAASRTDAVKDASLYAIGIIVTFVGLGFLLALLFGATGIQKLAANPWANIAIAAIFITFALNLFGMFELGVPSSVLTKLNMKANTTKNKRVSVILMGFVFSLTSFTCTVPIVGTLMVAFQRGDWFVPLVGMTTFATVFALPFFFLALFPSAMKALPKSGGWLNSVKVVMGFLELAAALKFISNIDLVWHWGIFSRDLVIAAWASIFVITALYLLGRFSLPHDTPSPHIGPIRAVFAVMFLTFGVFMFTGFNGKPLGAIDGLLPPKDLPTDAHSMVSAGIGSTAHSTANTEEKWHPRFSSALEEAKRTGKNIFIDFTGYTCTNCRSMESEVFSRADVQTIFKDFILAKLYTDDGSPLNDSNQVFEETRFNTIALPYYVIISPDDQHLGSFPGYTRDHQSFINFLNKYRAGGSPVAQK